jgi:hypothetical protein
MTEHVPAPSEHAPRKDMTTDPRDNEAIIWEEGKTVTGAWVKCDTSDLAPAIDVIDPIDR